MEVRGVQVPCSEIDINDVLGCTYWYSLDLSMMLREVNLNDLKDWLAPIIGIQFFYGWQKELSLKRNKWIFRQGYSLGLLVAILCHHKMSQFFNTLRQHWLDVLWTMDHQKLNFGCIIAPEIIIRVKQLHTSLLFLNLIKTLCRWAKVPFKSKIDILITPSASPYIQWIEAEF